MKIFMEESIKEQKIQIDGRVTEQVLDFIYL
jgi:hypothetical protein